MGIPLHKYWGDMSPLPHRDRRPCLYVSIHTTYIANFIKITEIVPQNTAVYNLKFTFQVNMQLHTEYA